MGERVLANLWVGLASMRTQARVMRGSPFAVILGVVQPAVFLLMVSGTNAARIPQESAQLVIGVGLTALWGSTIWSAGGVLRGDRLQGTLARSLTGMRSPTVVFLGKCLGATVRLSGVIAVSTVAVAVLLKLPVPLRRPGWMLLGVMVVLLSSTALGMLLSCLFLVTRHATAWSAVLMYPVFIVSGMMIPLHLVPFGLGRLSTVISLRWAAEYLSTAASGAPSWFAFTALLGLTCLYFVTAIVAFRWFLARARREGTFDHA